MLNQPWVLEDIDDAEAYTRAVLDKTLKARNQHLDWARYEDAHQDLLVAIWELAASWTPNGRKSFRQYAAPLLGLRYVDWLRRTEGRAVQWRDNGRVERERTPLLSLDDPGLEPSLGFGDSDSRGDSVADLMREVRARDRRTARH